MYDYTSLPKIPRYLGTVDYGYEVDIAGNAESDHLCTYLGTWVRVVGR